MKWLLSFEIEPICFPLIPLKQGGWEHLMFVLREIFNAVIISEGSVRVIELGQRKMKQQNAK